MLFSAVITFFSYVPAFATLLIDNKAMGLDFHP